MTEIIRTMTDAAKIACWKMVGTALIPRILVVFFTLKMGGECLPEISEQLNAQNNVETPMVILDLLNVMTAIKKTVMVAAKTASMSLGTNATAAALVYLTHAMKYVETSTTCDSLLVMTETPTIMMAAVPNAK